ncbi:hypothetical protein MTO96_047308, partial [Rhipicephalus appendiculatus]
RGPPAHHLDAASLDPVAEDYSTAEHHPQCYHSSSSRSPPSTPSGGLQNRLQSRRGGLDLRTTTNGVLLKTLCSLATIDYATARTADRVRINPYNNSLTVSTPSESRARLYLRVSELRLGTISYPRRAYMAAPDNALRGIIYNAVDSQTQDEIIQDLQSMNVNTPYAIADARRMRRSKSILITFVGTTTLPSTIVFNCGIYRCHPFRPKAEACMNCWTPGHRADVCTKPKSALCYRCGQTHETVEPPDLRPMLPPKAPSAPLLLVLRKALSCAGRNALVILGDFNASHTSWGYPQNTRKGHSLWNFIHNERLSILNNFTRPTRIGSSVQRDTNPDLALARNVADSSWCNTGISLGSDHYVLCTTFPLPSLARSSTRLAQVVDWDRFRSIGLSTSSSSPITDLSAWTETILADVRTATSTLPAAPHSTTADSRLLHLWEAYHAVHRRWQAQKHNRRLRLRLARLASDMEEHCSSLLRQQWGQTCDRMAGNLGLRDTWSLLRVLLDPTHTKASQRKDISHLLHSSSLTDTEFLATLRDRYLCSDPHTPLPAYSGSPNSDLDADISLGE